MDRKKEARDMGGIASYFKGFKALGRKGQAVSGISLFYGIVLLFIGLLVLGMILIFTDDFLGVQMHHYAEEYGVDDTALDHMETLRSIMPILVLFSLLIGLVISSLVYGG